MAGSIKDVPVDITELKADIEKNRQERLKFIDQYAEWLKKTPNDVWSRQQNNLQERGKAHLTKICLHMNRKIFKQLSISKDKCPKK
jgi:hypothetical protein